MAGDERQNAPLSGVSYTPKILRNMQEICDAFGVGKKTVRKWAQAGAPIVVEGDGRRVRYSAEMVEVQRWRKAREGQ